MPQTQGTKPDKWFRDALVRAVNRRDKGQDGKRGAKQISILADKLVHEGINGNITALTAIRDTLDGKPAQALEVAVQVQITRIERRIVDPKVIEHDDAKLIESDS